MPMPLGLVVMITVLILVFIASAVSLRWHFDEDRKKTISELQRKLDEISKDNETQPAPSPETVPSHQLILTMSEEGRVRERERDVSRQQIQQQEQEKQLQKTQTSLMTNKEKIKALSEGVFRSWNESPIGWICGGGTALALADLWVRWWTIGL